MAEHRPSPRRASPGHPPGAGSPLALGRDAHGGVRPADFPVLTNLAPADLASPALSPRSNSPAATTTAPHPPETTPTPPPPDTRIPIAPVDCTSPAPSR